MEDKFCPRCGVTKPRDEFYVSRRAKDGMTSYCRLCMVAYAREWNRDDVRQRLLAEQGGRCALCGTTEAKRWNMDHDHSCCPSGKLPGQRCGNCERGVLCSSCNSRLGWYERRVDVIADYLARRHGR
jgi:hypothetical protein